MKIPSGTPIDELLDGGIQTGIVTHVYGCAGSGKTTFALQVSINAALLGHAVLYIDAEEAFPANRLIQILGAEEDASILRRIAVSQPSSFDEQNMLLLRLSREAGEPWGLKKLKIVVVDTIARHYRIETANRPRMRLFRELAEKQMPALLKTARHHEVAVLVLNQVSSRLFGGQGLRPVGGDAVSRTSKYEIRLELEGVDEHAGWAKIRKTPMSQQIGKRIKYAITKHGIAHIKSTD